MSDNMDQELCMACRAGDEAAKDQLLVRHRNYVRAVAVSFYNDNRQQCQKLGYDEDDLTQIGCLKLCRLAEGYDPNRGAGFRTYCKKPLDNAMMDELRKESTARRLELESVDYDWSPEAAEDTEMSQFRYPEPEPACIRKETLEELRTALSRISDRDLTYLTYRFGLNDGIQRSQAEAARHFGLRPGPRKRAEKEALCHLRQQMP